jgi:hypothetical protein
MTISGDVRRPVGLTDIRERYAAAFYGRLWATPLRERWSLRNRESTCPPASTTAGGPNTSMSP